MAVYLGAIVSANLAVATFGQAALPLTAFVLIPFDLVTRDILHDKWKGRYLWWKMAGLVLGGSLLTAILSWNAIPIAIASTAAFALAGTTNAFVYHLMRKHKRLLRMNVSNLFAAVVDSLVFPFIAFESVSILLCGGQAAAKFGGGVFWSVLFVSLVAFTKGSKE